MVKANISYVLMLFNLIWFKYKSSPKGMFLSLPIRVLGNPQRHLRNMIKIIQN